jgi:magnesium transporter
MALQIFQYGATSVSERQPANVAECFPFAGAPLVTWLNVDGLHDVPLIREIGERAALHPLVVEDVLSTGQRPKVEDYDRQLFIVLRSLTWDGKREEIEEEQLSIVLGDHYVISFQEQPGDEFDPVRARIRNGKGAIRTRGADYLAYQLIDAMVDEYFTVLERVGDRLGDLENEVMTRPDQATIHEIHHLKRELLVMRKAVWPARDLLNALIRDECGLVSDNTRIFLRDAYDHAVQVIDTLETMRDLVSGLIDLYLSSVSNRLNEVMKLLTIIATIFIPLTFVAGVYGMNFDVMPELRWRWGYPAVMALMAAIGLGMLAWFRRKSWL